MTEITAERKAEIAGRIAAYVRQHDRHLADNDGHYAGCGCNPYQDVIYGLPEFAPGDARNSDVPIEQNHYYLSDGTEIEETDQGWRIDGALIDAEPA